MATHRGVLTYEDYAQLPVAVARGAGPASRPPFPDLAVTPEWLWP